jgi:hypothetical protein
MAQVGENNARVHAAACGALLELAAAPAAGLGGHLGLLTRPVKSQLQCRPVLHRLELLAALLREVPIAHTPQNPGGEGFQLEPLMAFVGAALGSPNADVRAAAVRTAAQVRGRPCMPPRPNAVRIKGAAFSLSCRHVSAATQKATV